MQIICFPIIIEAMEVSSFASCDCGTVALSQASNRGGGDTGVAPDAAYGDDDKGREEKRSRRDDMSF